MMNPDLVAQLQKIAAEQRNGSLVISLGSRKVRFGFEAGELVLLDLGEEKEVSMARKLLDYHKIGPEIHRHAVNTARATGASIIETLRRQQLVSEGEVDLVAQAMVEDLLSLVFGLTHADLSWSDAGADTYDLDKQAVRLRIDVGSLLAGAQARIEEEDAVLQEVGGFTSVFSLDEGCDPSQLDDFERHVLNMIDGRKSVENLAVAFRDSNLNMARHLVLLMRKGAIRRVAGQMSDRRAAVSTAAAAAMRDPSGVQRIGGSSTTSVPASTAGNAQAPTTFEVYRPPQQPSNIGMRIALVVVLIVVLGIGWLVMSYAGERQRIDGAMGTITEAITAKNWNQAESGISAARAQYGGDLAMVRRLDELSQQLAGLIGAEVSAANRAIEDQRLSDAADIIARIPSSNPEIPGLRQRLAARQKEFDDHLARQERAVRERLERNEVIRALALADQEDGEVHKALHQIIDRWRLGVIEEASLGTQSMGKRQQMLNLVQDARPTEAQSKRIETLQTELLRYQERRNEQLSVVRDLIAKGAFVEAQAAYDSNNLGDQAPGSDMEKAAQAVAAEIARVREQFEGAGPNLALTMAQSVDLKPIVAAAEALTTAAGAFSEPSNRQDLVRHASLITVINPILARNDGTDAEIAYLTKAAAETQDALVAQTLNARLATLRRVQAEADGALERAKTFLRDGNWEAGLSVLERLKATKDWARTPAARAVPEIIAQAERTRANRGALEADFRKALTAGDISKAFDLARELGMPYLPLLIGSTPEGAEVIHDGKILGKTPFIHEVTAGDRVEMLITLRLAGYEDQELKGADAVGGWKLDADLQRKPTASVNLGEIVTSQPGVDGDRIWVANNRVVIAVRPDGTFTSHGNGQEGASLQQPVYAAAQRTDGAMHLSTRDGFVLRITDDGKVERLSVPVTSDFAPAVYRSQIILDRRFLVLSAREGILSASDPREPGANWATTTGASFIAAPRIVGERVLAVRSDGTLIACQVDRGLVLASIPLNEEAVAAWPTKTGISGFTRKRAFSWDGVAAPVLSDLPREIIAGNDGLLVSRDRQVLLHDGEEWKIAGAISGRVNGVPVRWGDAAAIPEGGTLEVIGSGGFRLTSDGAFMNPVVADGRLVIVTSDGTVRFYDPR